MFFKSQSVNDQKSYKEMLGIAGAISKLYSDSVEPYIPYRTAENAFCSAFNAINHARQDMSIDASKDKTGIAIKTFLYKNGKTYEKISEFDRDSDDLRKLKLKEMILKIAELHNQRINDTRSILNIENMIYHCVTRKIKQLLIYEEPLQLIEIQNIKNIVRKKNTVFFKDSLNEYKFYLSKSTLLKRFNVQNILIDLPINILDNPFETLLGAIPTHP